MPQLRVALAQVDVTVGDLAGNADCVARETARAATAGAHLVVFPEMALTGYPPEDLVLRRSFVRASQAAIHRLAERLAGDGLGDVAVVVGYLDACPDPAERVGRPAGEPQNTAAILYGGQVVSKYAKHHLPNYGVFDEFRYFVPGDVLPVVRLHGVDVAVTICEDLWQAGGPIAAARQAEAGLVLTINGSPYERHKDDVRCELARRRAAEAGATLAYVNMVGGQDELVFDGDSIVVDPYGAVLARAAQFREQLLVVDLDLPAATGSHDAGSNDEWVDAEDGTRMRIDRVVLTDDPLPPYDAEPAEIAPRLDDLAETWAALVTAVRDYTRKNNFDSVLLGLSGGIDSAVVATIAADALGSDAVHVVGLPSRYSSDHSVADAEELATRQGLHWTLLPIGGVVEAYEKAFTDIGGLQGVAEENLQARVRGTAWMAMSNQQGHLMLTAGNKSELATGFSTLYGDTAGGFAPIKDVPKTLVWELARWRNTVAADADEVEPIPPQIIDKPPSAELAPGQLDVDRLPPYELLDEVLVAYVEEDKGHEELVAAGYDPELVAKVIRMVDQAEWKRRQYPPGPKISPKNFGRDRRLPITNAWRE